VLTVFIIFIFYLPELLITLINPQLFYWRNQQELVCQKKSNKSRALYRRDKVDKLRNLVENFNNMSLKDYLDVVIFFFE
jgi:hypothetical protein